jgi:hypothetical protein
MINTKLFDLPFNDVIDLYQQRMLAEEKNDLRLRTKLLLNHPELFNNDVMAQLMDTFKKIISLQHNRPS